MGAWDSTPWGNDRAADWFGDLFDEIQLRQKWVEGINSESPDIRRAAIALFLFLGRVYVWPIDNYENDLNLCIKEAKSLLTVPEYNQSNELIKVIKKEIKQLKSRLKDN